MPNYALSKIPGESDLFPEVERKDANWNISTIKCLKTDSDYLKNMRDSRHSDQVS